MSANHRAEPATGIRSGGTIRYGNVKHVACRSRGAERDRPLKEAREGKGKGKRSREPTGWNVADRDCLAKSLAAPARKSAHRLNSQGVDPMNRRETES